MLVKLVTEALASQSQGNLSGAMIAYKRIQRQFPDFVDAWINGSIILRLMGRIDEALNVASHASTLSPNNPSAYFVLASAHQSLKAFGEAIHYYQKALECDPAYIQALISLAEIFAESERYQEAMDTAQRAVALDSENPNAICALANAQQKLDIIDEATNNYRHALKCAPSHQPALTRLAALYFDSGDFAGALELENRALQHYPSDPLLLITRSRVKLHLMDLAGAESDVKRALELDANQQVARSFLVVLLLLQHRYREGWASQRARGYYSVGSVTERNLGKPYWKGEALEGQTLLVFAEHHGFGDSIQFARYFPYIKQKYGCRVILLTYKPMKRLLEGVPGLDGLVVEGEPLPHFDAIVPVLGLPVVMDIDASGIPPPTEIIAEGSPLPELRSSGLKVGLVWGGNPVHIEDAQRSISPRHFDSLADILGIAWYGLQIPPAVEPPALPGFIDMSPHISDFMDTARIARQLDLIVTVDTSVAHLTASLNLPTILLLKYIPDWRWGFGGQTPWYPSVTILRQQTPKNWEKVIQSLKERIQAHANTRPTTG
jgi:tetratricopeptide (TPR) repeat protein